MEAPRANAATNAIKISKAMFLLFLFSYKKNATTNTNAQTDERTNAICCPSKLIGGWNWPLISVTFFTDAFDSLSFPTVSNHRICMTRS